MTAQLPVPVPVVVVDVEVALLSVDGVVGNDPYAPDSAAAPMAPSLRSRHVYRAACK
jgi:hypothetical protein